VKKKKFVEIFDPNLNQIVSPFLDIFFKELLWFGIWVQKGFNFLPFLDFSKKNFGGLGFSFF